MRVTAYDGHARQRQSALRTYDVDNAVLFVHHTEMGQSKLLGIAGQRIHLCLAHRVFDGLVLVVSRRVVVRHTVDLLWAKALQATTAHTFKSLRTGHLMAIESVDIELSGTIFHLLHHVGIPNLIKKSVHKLRVKLIVITHYILNLLIQSI